MALLRPVAQWMESEELGSGPVKFTFVTMPYLAHSRVAQLRNSQDPMLPSPALFFPILLPSDFSVLLPKERDSGWGPCPERTGNPG